LGRPIKVAVPKREFRKSAEKRLFTLEAIYYKEGKLSPSQYKEYKALKRALK